MLIQFLKSTRLIIAIIIALYIAMYLGLESPEWAVTSVLIISMGTIGEIQARWWQRILGNILGGAIGFFLIWWLVQDTITIMLAICLFSSLCAYVSITNFLYKDMWRWIILGFIIVVSASLSNPDKAFNIFLARIACIFIGSSVIFILSALWPIDYVSSIKKQYYGIIDTLSDFIEKNNEDILVQFLNFTQQITNFRMSLSVNYSDYRMIYPQNINNINRVHTLEKLGRNLYLLKAQHMLTPEIQCWIKASLQSIKYHTIFCHKEHNSLLINLINTNFIELTEIKIATREISLLRWKWQNRMFNAGTDSAFISSCIFFITILFSLILWRHNWPGGNIVVLLTAIILVMCQYGERVSPRNLLIGFIIGTIYAFPVFIFLLPNLHNANAFWLGLIIMYFPLVFIMYGEYKSRTISAIAFAITIMINVNSHNYIPSSTYINNYITFVFVLIAVVLISSAALNLLIIKDTETRLRMQINVWTKEKRYFLIDPSYYRVKNLARFERRTDIILSLYSKLDIKKQKKWQKKVASLPLILSRIQCWGNI